MGHKEDQGLQETLQPQGVMGWSPADSRVQPARLQTSSTGGHHMPPPMGLVGMMPGEGLCGDRQALQ